MYCKDCGNEKCPVFGKENVQVIYCQDSKYKIIRGDLNEIDDKSSYMEEAQDLAEENGE